MPGVTIAGLTFDAHTLLVSSLALTLGLPVGAVCRLQQDVRHPRGLLAGDPRLDRFYRFFGLEQGLLAGAAAMVVGLVLLLLGAVNQWRLADFGRLDYAHTMRDVVPG